MKSTLCSRCNELIQLGITKALRPNTCSFRGAASLHIAQINTLNRRLNPPSVVPTGVQFEMNLKLVPDYGRLCLRWTMVEVGKWRENYVAHLSDCGHIAQMS